MIIAVTGSLGSGKSTVSRMLALALAAPVCSADRICHDQLLPGAAGLLAVEQRWGDRFVRDGRFNREAMRVAVFADQAIREQLEAIIYPLAYRALRYEIKKARCCGTPFVAEIPLLFEKGWTESFERIVVVRVLEQQIYSRVNHRDGRGAEEIRKILAVQMPQAEKIARADAVIDNSGTFCATRSQVAWFSEIILQKLVEKGGKKA